MDNNYYYIIFLVLVIVFIFNFNLKKNMRTNIKLGILVVTLLLLAYVSLIKKDTKTQDRHHLLEKFTVEAENSINKLYDYYDINEELVCFISTFDTRSFTDKKDILLDLTPNKNDFVISNNVSLNNAGIDIKTLHFKGPLCNELGIDAMGNYTISFYLNFKKQILGELFRISGNVTTSVIMRIYIALDDNNIPRLYIDYNGTVFIQQYDTPILRSQTRVELSDTNFLFTITKNNEHLKVYKDNILKDDIRISDFKDTITFSNNNIYINPNKELDITLYSFLIYNRELTIQQITSLSKLFRYLDSIILSIIRLPSYNNGQLYYNYTCTDEVKDIQKKYQDAIHNYHNLLKIMKEKDKEILSLIDVNNSCENKLRTVKSVSYLNNYLKNKLSPKCNEVDTLTSMYKQNVDDVCKTAISNHCKKKPNTLGCICNDPAYKNIPDCIKFNNFLLSQEELKKKEKVLKINCPPVNSLTKYL